MTMLMMTLPKRRPCSINLIKEKVALCTEERWGVKQGSLMEKGLRCFKITAYMRDTSLMVTLMDLEEELLLEEKYTKDSLNLT